MHPNFRVIATVLQLKDLRFSYFFFFFGGFNFKIYVPHLWRHAPFFLLFGRLAFRHDWWSFLIGTFHRQASDGSLGGFKSCLTNVFKMVTVYSSVIDLPTKQIKAHFLKVIMLEVVNYKKRNREPDSFIITDVSVTLLHGTIVTAQYHVRVVIRLYNISAAILQYCFSNDSEGEYVQIFASLNLHSRSGNLTFEQALR